MRYSCFAKQRLARRVRLCSLAKSPDDTMMSGKVEVSEGDEVDVAECKDSVEKELNFESRSDNREDLWSKFRSGSE